jgi:hypothetical protein
LLVWLDRSGKFLGQMQFANLFVIAPVAAVMDGYMQRNALSLLRENAAWCVNANGPMLCSTSPCPRKLPKSSKLITK